MGAQLYLRNVGNLGNAKPQLDWAVADYRFADYFGVRAGVVKTTFGLHNDEQDMEFLHTNALLPQSICPVDLRDALIRHRGGDIYGRIPIGELGSLSYTAFAGQRKDSRDGGYGYLLRSNANIDLNEYGGLQYGGDLRWSTPLEGLLIGASHMNQDITGKGTWTYASDMANPNSPLTSSPYEEKSNKDQANQGYIQYTAGKVRLEAEYRRWWRDQKIFNGMGQVSTDTRSWYALGAYRVAKRLELGAYYSNQATQWTQDFVGTRTVSPTQSAPDRHVYDKVVSARFDVTRNWNVKVEGHFIDGWGGQMYPNGFYSGDHPKGVQPQANVLIIRTGWNF